MAKKWFVIMWEDEIMGLPNLGERAIYAAIKSYCSNGKTEAALSIRDIARRAGVHYSTADRWIPRLCDKKLIRIVDYKMRVGGQVPVYRVLQGATPSVAESNALSVAGVAQSEESVAQSEESVAVVGTNLDKVKSKKEYIENTNKLNTGHLKKSEVGVAPKINVFKLADKMWEQHLINEKERAKK